VKKVLRLSKYLPFLFLVPFAYGSDTADYKVLPGTLHQNGKVVVNVLPDQDHYRVKMDYDVKKKELVPVPDKLLHGSTVMEFPQKFRTEQGYKDLEQKKTMKIRKAELRFIKRADYKDLKDAYFIEVRPTNKKSRIDIIYHPSLPSVGWMKVEITFLSKIPVLNGYELEAVLKR
jgi:hypothetical protein